MEQEDSKEEIIYEITIRVLRSNRGSIRLGSSPP